MLVNTFSSKQVNVPNEGRHYEIVELDGSFQGHLKSVTTILGYAEPKEGLFEWRKRVGNDEANRISNFTASVGTKVHGYAEDYFLKNCEPDVTEGIEYECYKRFKPLLEIIEPLGVEHKTYWYKEGIGGFSGTLDLCGRIDPRYLKSRGTTNFSNYDSPIVGVMDFKTWCTTDKKGSYKTKTTKVVPRDGQPFYPLMKHCVQIAAYCAALNQRTKCEYNIQHGFIFGTTPTARNAFIYYLNPDAICFYWERMKEIVYCYNNQVKFDWKLMEREADRWNFLGERVDVNVVKKS